MSLDLSPVASRHSGSKSIRAIVTALADIVLTALLYALGIYVELKKMRFLIYQQPISAVS